MTPFFSDLGRVLYSFGEIASNIWLATIWIGEEYIKVVLHLSCKLCTEEACKRRLPQKEKKQKKTPKPISKATAILKQILLDQSSQLVYAAPEGSDVEEKV